VPNRPLYMRQVRQALRAADGSFDERRYGFRSTLDFLHEGQRQGVLRLQRDHKGVWRIFPLLTPPAEPAAADQPAAPPALPADAGDLEPMAPEVALEPLSAVPESLAATEAVPGEVPAPTIEEVAMPEAPVPEAPLSAAVGELPPPAPARKGRKPRAASPSGRSTQRRKPTRRKPRKTT